MVVPAHGEPPQGPCGLPSSAEDAPLVVVGQRACGDLSQRVHTVHALGPQYLLRALEVDVGGPPRLYVLVRGGVKQPQTDASMPLISMPKSVTSAPYMRLMKARLSACSASVSASTQSAGKMTLYPRK